MPIKFTLNPLSGNFDEISEVALTGVGSSPNPQGASIDSSQNLTLQPADGSNPGLMTAVDQTFAGNKQFEGIIIANNDVQVDGLITADGGIDVSVSNNLVLGPTNAASVIIGNSTSPVEIVGDATADKTLTVDGLLNADGGIDLSSSGTLTIGATNSTVINIGNSGATVNIQGTTIYENTPQLLTADPLITVNHGGGAGSGQNAGIQIEEASSITGYAETSSDRNSWILKAPNTAGIATITPGVAGIVLNQSSHDPITLTTVGSSPNSNAASLSGQVLNLQPADASNPGVITSGTQTIGGNKTFNGSVVVPSLTVATLNGPVRASSGVISTGATSLTSEVSGVLPVANGGTNSGTALNSNRLVGTISGAIVEMPALTDGQLFIGRSGNSPLQNTLTAGTGISITNGTGTITVTNSNVGTGDIPTTSIALLQSQTNTNVTGLTFSNASIRAFEAQVSVAISASSNLYEMFTLRGIQRDTDWVMSVTSVGDNSLVSFTITTSGQVQYTDSTYSGFTSGAIRFRAIALPV